MRITYTGRHEELTPQQRQKLQVKFEKIAKMIEHGPDSEREAHVILTNERFLQNVEITLNAYDHALVGMGSDSDLFTALNLAIEKLEKQVVRMRTKWRATHRGKGTKAAQALTEEAAEEPGGAGATSWAARPRVFRVDGDASRKPMTVDEALLEIPAQDDYFVYRDARTGNLSVLVRRGDGNFDLVEGC